jgi:hypothetical protein
MTSVNRRSIPSSRSRGAADGRKAEQQVVAVSGLSAFGLLRGKADADLDYIVRQFLTQSRHSPFDYLINEREQRRTLRFVTSPSQG